MQCTDPLFNRPTHSALTRTPSDSDRERCIACRPKRWPDPARARSASRARGARHTESKEEKTERNIRAEIQLHCSTRWQWLVHSCLRSNQCHFGHKTDTFKLIVGKWRRRWLRDARRLRRGLARMQIVLARIGLALASGRAAGANNAMSPTRRFRNRSNI